jgi:BMFP domain-containing protein YqiC
MSQSQSRQSSSRRQLAHDSEQAIRQQADPVSLEISNAIDDHLGELQKNVRAHLKACLSPVQKYLETMPNQLDEAKATSSQQRLQEIEQNFRRLFPT